MFSASLPLGKPGFLQREVTITNETKGTSCKLELDLTVTSTVAEDSYLHCIVLSDATPAGGEKASRAREIILKNPGEQLMELFADRETGSRLLLAVRATLSEPQPAPPKKERWPRIMFSLKVEQWAGAKRVKIDNLQLASEEGSSVVHDYKKEVPKWVESATGSEEQDPLSGFPILDPKSDDGKTPAGQSFTLLLPEDARSGKKLGGKKENGGGIWTLTDSISQADAGGGEKKLEWVEESMKLTIAPVSLEKGLLTVHVSGTAETVDGMSGKPLSIPYREQMKGLRKGEPMTFYLTVEGDGGGRGYAVWIVPEW